MLDGSKNPAVNISEELNWHKKNNNNKHVDVTAAATAYPKKLKPKGLISLCVFKILAPYRRRSSAGQQNRDVLQLCS